MMMQFSLWNSLWRPRLKTDCGLVLLVLFVLLTTSLSGRTEIPKHDASADLIEVHYAPDMLAPYKERRRLWAPVVGFNFSDFKTTGFISDFTDEFDTDYKYDDLFGAKKMRTFSVYGGIQFNIGPISFAPTVGYLTGSVRGEALAGITVLNVTVQRAGLNVNLDGIMAEPYIVPTFQFDVNVANYTEEFTSSDGVNTSERKTNPFFSYTAGVLLQLNWIDRAAALESLKVGGLNNTFIHLYLGQFMAPSGPGTSFASPVSLGAGVKLEF